MILLNVGLDKRTKAGKEFLEILESFQGKKGVIIVESPFTVEQAIKIKKIEADIKSGKIETISFDPDNIKGSLGI